MSAGRATVLVGDSRALPKNSPWLAIVSRPSRPLSTRKMGMTSRTEPGAPEELTVLVTDVEGRKRPMALVENRSPAPGACADDTVGVVKRMSPRAAPARAVVLILLAMAPSC